MNTGEDPKVRNKLLAAWLCFGILAAMALSGCRRGRKQEKASRSAVEEALDQFIAAQENGDRDTVLDFVVSEHREAFKQILDGLEHNDVVATGLQFREEEYKLEETTEQMAIFWSQKSNLYLVMMREEGLWRVDPKRTDEMNADSQN